MITDHIRDFMNQAGCYPLLTPDQEIQLSRQVHRMLLLEASPGQHTARENHEIKIGRRARNTIIQSNIRLVIHVAKRHRIRLRSNGLDMMDLIQEGMIGLQRAAEKFDGSKGYRFSTYAYWWIRQAISRAIDTRDKLIRVPQHAIERIHDIARMQSGYTQLHGKKPTLVETAEALDMPCSQVQFLMRCNVPHCSLDALMTEDGSPLIEMIADQADDSQTLAMEYGEQLHQAFLQLTPQEQEIVSSRYSLYGSEYKTLEKIGQDQGLTRERIRQKLVVAERKLRIALNQ